MDEMIAGTDIGFQSAPVIANGRIKSVVMDVERSSRFQSTPVIANGRLLSPPGRGKPARWFQSTPVIANGRISALIARITQRSIVSIHARYC